MIETVHAYFAGLIDGEGWITIHKDRVVRPNRKTRSYSLAVAVGMTKPGAVSEMHQLWGGSYQIRKLKNKNHVPQHVVKVSARQCRQLLLDILPYLRVKKPQAELALEFLEHMENSKSETLYGKNPDGRRGRAVPNHIIEIRESFYEKMKELNYRGVKEQN